VLRDHGTEFRKIPFDLQAPEGRRLLFEELACCAVSCAWHPRGAAAMRTWLDAALRADGSWRPVERRAREGVRRALADAGAPHGMEKSFGVRPGRKSSLPRYSSDSGSLASPR